VSRHARSARERWQAPEAGRSEAPSEQGSGSRQGTVSISVKQPSIRSDIHTAARRWYRSLKTSGQAEFYTDSDWQTALVAAEVLDRFFATSRATLLAEFNRMCTSLLVTEGDRRRARLELERTAPESEEGASNAADIDEARRRLRACE
jgi:hypothetical protein